MHPLFLIKIGVIIVGLLLIFAETTLIVVNKHLSETNFGYLIGTITLTITLIGTLITMYAGLSLK